MAKPSLFKCTKLKRLMKLTGLARAHAVGHLECLWHAQYDRGSPVIGDVDDVEMAAEWEGEPGKLTRALLKTTFIDPTGQIGVYQVHDYTDHIPEYVKKRIEYRDKRLEKELQQKMAAKSPPNETHETSDKDLQPFLAEDFRDAAENFRLHTKPDQTIPNTAAGAAVSPAAGGSPAKEKASTPAQTEPIDPNASNADGATAVRPPTSDSGKPAKQRRIASGAHHELIATFCDGWQARYQAPYAFNAGKDGRHIKWILDVTFHDLAEAKKIVEAYLRDEDAWLIERAHPLGQLVSSFNRYRAAAHNPPGRGVRHDNPSRNRNGRPSAEQRGEFAEPELDGALSRLAAAEKHRHDPGTG